MPWHGLEDVFKHRIDVFEMAAAERALFLRFLLSGSNFRRKIVLELVVALVVPRAELDQMALQPLARTAQRPFGPRALRRIRGRIVRGRMSLGPVREQFDQRGPEIAPGTIRGPSSRGV